MQKALVYLSISAGLALGTSLLLTTTPRTQSTQAASLQPDLKYASAHLSKMRYQPPMDLTFAGESVPMDNPMVSKKLQKELNQKIQHTAGTHQLYRRVFRYRQLFTKILREQDIPTDFFYLSMAESALSNAISPVGAAGFWQFMPTTARAYGLTVNEQIDERFDPVKATYAATRYFKVLYKEHHSWTLVAAAYNMGSAGLSRQIAAQGDSTYYTLRLNHETGAYLYRILSSKCIVEQPARYGYDMAAVTPYTPIRYEYVRVKEDIPNLATFAAKHGLSLDQLFTVNPWLQTLSLSADQTLSLRIPLNKDFFAAELKVRDWSSVMSEQNDDEQPKPDTAQTDSIHRVVAS